MGENRQRRSGLAEGLGARLDAMPERWRPVGYGAAFIVFLMLWRGALFLVPLALVALLLTSGTPLRDLAGVLLAFALAVLGGGLAGLSYALVGRPLRRLPIAGPYAAGMVTALPYVAVVQVIERLSEGRLLARPDAGDLLAVGLLTVVFGGVLGHVGFRRAAGRARSEGQAT